MEWHLERSVSPRQPQMNVMNVGMNVACVRFDGDGSEGDIIYRIYIIFARIHGRFDTAFAPDTVK